MLFFAGVLGVMQVTVLPGLLVLRVARWQGRILSSAALCFAISLLSNYLISILLVSLRLFRPPVVWALVLAELFTLVWVWRDLLIRPLGQVVDAIWRQLPAAADGWRVRLAGAGQPNSLTAALRLLLFAAALAVALFLLFWAASQWARNLGSVFGGWDAVLSWNRWALEWAQGSAPADLGYYPQLVPLNWAVIYQLMGNTPLQFFSKALMPLFFIFMLLLLFEWGWSQKSYGAWLGLAVTYLGVRHFLGDTIAEGYMDVPVACLAFLSIYLLLDTPPGAVNPQTRRRLWFSALCAAAAALTKQSGLFILLLWPLLAFLLAGRGLKGPVRRAVFFPWIASLLVVFSFYLYRYSLISQGLDSDNIAYLVHDIYNGEPVMHRMQTAFGAMGRYGSIFVFILVALVWQKPVYRWLTVLVLVPYLAIWAGFFSYDTRNIALALPILGLVAGAGIEGLVERGLNLPLWLKVERLRIWILAAFALMVLAAVSLFVPDNTLLRAHDRAQRQIFNPDLNQKLYSYLEEEGQPGRILTNYPLDFLPELKGRQRSFWYNDQAVFLSELKDPANRYLLVPHHADEEIQELIEELILSGDLVPVFDSSEGYSYRFLRIIRPAGP